MRKHFSCGASLFITVLLALIVAGCGGDDPASEVSDQTAIRAETDDQSKGTAPKTRATPGKKFSEIPNLVEIPIFANDRLLRATIPPEGSVPETGQWPAALQFEVNGSTLVLYARHEKGFDPETKTGKLTVWIGCPPAYIEEVEKKHPFGPADAAAYLRQAGIKRVAGEIYIGPGNKSGPGPGYKAWTMATDRCVACVLEPKKGRQQMVRLSTWAVTDNGKVSLYRGPLTCDCPSYPTASAVADWIYIIGREKGKPFYVVDQWGLPGCSPVPES